MSARIRGRGTGLRGQIGSSFATSAGVQAVNIVTGVILARALGPHGRGELAAILLWPTILAAVGTLGVSEATTYHAARSTGSLGKLVGSTLLIGVVQSVVCVGIGAGILPLVLSHYGSHAVHLAYVYLVYIPIFLFNVYAMTIIQGLHRFRSFNVLRFLVVGVSGVGLLTLDIGHWLVVNRAVYIYLAAYTLTGIFAGYLLFAPERMELGLDRELIRRLLGFGIRSHVSTVSNLLNERLDQLIISVFLAPVKLGLYVVAVSLTSLNTLTGYSISLIALPTVARMEHLDERRLKVRRFVQLTLIASIVSTIPMLLFTPQILSLFFGEAFRSVANVTRVLLVATVSLGLNRVLGAAVKGMGEPLQAGIAEGIALVVTVVGLAALLPFYGLMGAAVASILAYTTSTAWLLARTTRALDLPVRKLVLPTRIDALFSGGGVK